MSKNMPANNPNIAENEAKKTDNKYASLEEDYLELQREIKGLRKKQDEGKGRRKQLEAEVRFLRSRKRMFESKKLLELPDPEASTKDHLKMMSENRSSMALIEGLPIQNDPITYGSHLWPQQGKSQLYSSLPETTGVQSSTLARQQTPSDTPIGDPASKKRRLQSNDTPNSSESKKKKHKEKGRQKPGPPTDEGSDNNFNKE